MAGNIKGLTIEIGGSTTKLTDALKGPIKEAKNLRGALKDVDKALNLDPGNTDLLAQKQRLLAKTITATEQELKLLKQAQAEYIASGKDIDAAEYVNLESKIAICEKALKNLQAQQDSFSGKLKTLGQGLQTVGSGIESAGKALMPVTAGITAVGAASTAAWKELDEAYDGIAAGTGATGQALEELNGVFDEVFTSVPADAKNVSTAIADINTRLGLYGEDLADAAELFLKFSEVNGTEVGPSIESVAKAMADAGIPASELEKTMDMLTTVSQSTGLSSITLADSLAKNGVQMRELGFSTEETAAFLGTLEKNGADASTVITGMKTAFKNCAKEGRDGKTEFKKFFDGIASGSATAQEAIDLFGSKSGASIYQLAKDGKLNFSDLLEAAQNSGGQMTASYEAMLDPVDKLKVSMNQLKEIGAKLFDSIVTVAQPLLEKVTDTVKELADRFNSLTDQQKESIVKWGAFAAALGPALIGIGKITSGLGSTLSFLGGLPGSITGTVTKFQAFAAALGVGSGALMGAVAGIAALGAAFATLWNSNEDFRRNITQTWEGIKKTFSDFCTGIVERLNALGFSFKDITEVIQAVWQGFCEFLGPIFEGVWENIRIILDTVLNTITGLLDVFIGLFTGNWSQAWDGVKKVFSTAWDSVTQTFSNWTTTIKGLVDQILGWFGTSFSQAWDGVKSTTKNVWDGIKSAIETPINAARDIVKSAIDKIKGFFDFKIEWPKIPVPHFTISGSLNPLDWLSNGLPKIGVEFYAKAMDFGRILTRPTIFGMQDGKFLAGGESGPEAVVGVSSLNRMIQNAVLSAMNPYRMAAGTTVTQYVTINTQSVDRQNIDAICMQINKRLGAAL